MNNAVTLSDEMFELSGELAKKLKVSRSKVVSMGIKNLAAKHEYDEEELIAKINAVCEKVDTSLDPFWKKAQAKILEKNEW